MSSRGMLTGQTWTLWSEQWDTNLSGKETNDVEVEQHPSLVVEWDEHDGELSQPSDQRGARGVAEAAREQPAEVTVRRPREWSRRWATDACSPLPLRLRPKEAKGSEVGGVQREQRQRSSSGREGRVRRPETDERPPPCLEELVTTSPRFRKPAGLSAARGFCISMGR